MGDLFSNLWAICSVICGNCGFGWIKLMLFYQNGHFFDVFLEFMRTLRKTSFIMQKQRKNSIIFVASATIILFLHNHSNIIIYEEKFTLSHRLG